MADEVPAASPTGLTRADIATAVRRLLRQSNAEPLTDDMIYDAIEDAIDDLSNRLPYLTEMTVFDITQGAVELALPSDTLEIIEVFYRDSPTAAVASDITATVPATGDTTSLTIAVTGGKKASAVFPASGTIQIDNELIGYKSIQEDNTLYGITRGVDGTIPASHTKLGSVIYDADTKFTRLEPSTTRNIGDEDDSYLSSTPGTPTRYYETPGVLGFDVPFSRTAKAVVKVRRFKRSPKLTQNTDVIQGLPTTLNKAIKFCIASLLGILLGSDETALTQSQKWYQGYLAEVSQYKNRLNQMDRGLVAQIVPFTGRK